ncbi:archease [Stetteria hydrogenophila]
MAEAKDYFEGVECPGFAHGEHTADVLVIAKGRTLEELFEQSALAVYEIITDTSKVKPRIRVDIRESGIDLYNLLYRWVEALLFHTDAEGLVFSIFRVCRIWEENGEWKLDGSAWGEKFDPQRHEHRTIVKAMTYAQMEIKQLEDGCWGATFVPDI